MDKSQRLETINNLKLAIELAGDGGPQPFTSEEYKLMYELMDELEKQESLKYTDNSILYISEDDTDDFFVDSTIRENYEKIIGKCFINKPIGCAVKIIGLPVKGVRNWDGGYDYCNFIYERFDKYQFSGWEIEDYNWLQEQTEPEYENCKLTPYANINIASENMFHVGKNGNLYTTVDCGDEWYEFTEISNEEFEKIRNEAIEISD